MIYQHISGLIHQAIKDELIEDSDEIYVRNQIMNLLGLNKFPKQLKNKTIDSIPNILNQIVLFAIQQELIKDSSDEKEMLSANIMNCFIPRPSEINRIFNEKFQKSPIEATNYFYQLSKNSHYIQMNQIKKNISFHVTTTYGNLEITINLAKPEKDPEQIRKERVMAHYNPNYPQCLLCIENEGFVGRVGYPARANHRIIKIPLMNENWYMQYSPYLYYEEHCILLSEEHRDMKIDRMTFARLVEFVDKFPHFFIGSNADLPIVGGSILSHDHYQAGRYEFPIMKSEVEFIFRMEKFPAVEASVLKWPLSVIRLRSKQKEDLVTAGDLILQSWRGYTDEKADIYAFTDDTPHNTITPIARKLNEQFELTLVLRNNRTTAHFPLGIFHPHPDVHHIKKENIGLIEVMGLAVLPPRLKDELEEVSRFIQGQPCQVKDYHLNWAQQLKKMYHLSPVSNQVEELIQEELGKKFVRILKDTAVFKEKRDFAKFIESVNRFKQ